MGRSWFKYLHEKDTNAGNETGGVHLVNLSLEIVGETKEFWGSLYNHIGTSGVRMAVKNWPETSQLVSA